MWFRLAIICIVLWYEYVVGAYVWPQPLLQGTSDVIYIYNPDKFDITVSPQNKSNCPLIMATIQRFKHSMQTMQDIVTKQRWHHKNMRSEIDGEESDKVNSKPTIELPPLARSKRDLVIGLRQDEDDNIRQQERKQMNLFLYSTEPNESNKEQIKPPQTYATTTTRTPTTPTSETEEQLVNELNGLSITLTTESPQKYPYFNMNENYTIYLNHNRISLIAAEIWGIMRGMETVSQLFFLSADYRDIAINKTYIEDEPNYPHRGLLLDTAQHYISVDSILQTLDAMAMNKMNVFHWLLVNDDSFPFQSEKHPELSEAGSYHPKLVYTKFDIQKVVEYARTVGIRVIPELDIPTNVGSIQVSHPDLIVECPGWLSKEGILNPLLDETYELLGDLYQELLELFPDDYLHFGGSGIHYHQRCWENNPIISKYIKDHNITISILLTEFYQRMVAVIPASKKIIMWEDPYIKSEFTEPLLKNIVIEIDNNKRCVEWAIPDQKQIVWSMNYKLGNGDDAESEFVRLYASDPRYVAAEFVRCSILLHKYVIGAEVTVTKKTVDDTNIHSHIWPRASAVAEVLWSKNITRSTVETLPQRAKEQACRMRRHGFSVPLMIPGCCVTADNVVRANFDHFENGPGRLL